VSADKFWPVDDTGDKVDGLKVDRVPLVLLRLPDNVEVCVWVEKVLRVVNDLGDNVDELESERTAVFVIEVRRSDVDDEVGPTKIVDGVSGSVGGLGIHLGSGGIVLQAWRVNRPKMSVSPLKSLTKK